MADPVLACLRSSDDQAAALRIAAVSPYRHSDRRCSRIWRAVKMALDGAWNGRLVPIPGGDCDRDVGHLHHVRPRSRYGRVAIFRACRDFWLVGLVAL